MLDRANQKKLIVAIVVIGIVFGAIVYFTFSRERPSSKTVAGKLFNGKLSRDFEFSEGDYITYQQSSEAMTAIATQPIILKVTDVSENGYTVKLIDTFREEKHWEKTFRTRLCLHQSRLPQQERRPFLPKSHGRLGIHRDGRWVVTCFCL